VLSVSHDGKTELCQLTDVQRDAFGSSVMHVDLRVIDKNKEMHGMVDIVIKGDAIGVKAGGLIRIPLRALDVRALPANMPLEIIVHVDELDINDSLHVGEIKLPEGVTAITDSHQMVVQVIPPAGESEDDDAAEGSAEPEVIAKGKKEEE
jgi:large subunit ribosomal protein L25